MRNAFVSCLMVTSALGLAACSSATMPSAVVDSANGITPAVASGAQAKPTEAAPPKPAGKISPEMVGKISPIPAMMASGDDWTFEMHGTQGMEHRATLLFDNGKKRFEGTVTYRDTSEHAGVRWMRFDGKLRNERGDADFSMTVGKQTCNSRDGHQLGHTMRFVLGRAEYVGCAEVAMY